jgi:hypothetical protein
MDVGAASALALYNYQTALKAGSQGTSGSTASSGTQATATSSSLNPTQDAAILQALANTYGSLSTVASGVLAAPDTLGSLVSGMYSLSSAGGAPISFSGLAASLATEGGLDTSSASILFSTKDSSSSSSGFTSAMDLNAKLALASYTSQQAGLPTGTVGAAAASAASKVDTTQTSSVQAAIQSAQSGVTSSLLNLLA